MTRQVRLALFAVGVAGVAALLCAALLSIPGFGTPLDRYARRAVAASLQQRHTASVVASVTFDQRGLDTLGEEFMLFAAVLGAMALLRRNPDEEELPSQRGEEGRPPVLDALRFSAYLLLPLTVVVGIYLVLHGQLTPGGGFQGGVVIGSAVHLVYLAGDYPTLDRLRPIPVFEVMESVAAGAFVILGLGGMLTGAAFLTNVMPYGTLGDLLSGGVVPLFNVIVGVEVASAIVLLLAKFLEQALLVRPNHAGEESRQ